MTVSRAVTGRCTGGFVLLNMHLAAGLPTVEDTQVSTLLSTDDGCLLSRVGVVTTDDLSGKLIQVRKNGFRSTTLKPKSSSQEHILQHIPQQFCTQFKLFSYQAIDCVNNASWWFYQEVILHKI